MKTTKDLTQFTGYDLAVAQCHIASWGVIYLDEYDCPMEVGDVIYMFELEEELKEEIKYKKI